MTTYAWDAPGYSIKFGPQGGVIKAIIDIPYLIQYGGLDAALPSTGFAAADILEVFPVPQGFVAVHGGYYTVTGEGATCVIDLGVIGNYILGTAHSDGWLDGVSIETADAGALTLYGDDYGSAAFPGILFDEQGSIDITFEHADTETAVFEIWVCGYMAKSRGDDW